MIWFLVLALSFLYFVLPVTGTVLVLYLYLYPVSAFVLDYNSSRRR